MLPRNRFRLSLQGLLFVLLACGALLSQKVEVSQDPSWDSASLKNFGFEQGIRSVTDPFYAHPQAEQWVQDALRQGLIGLGCEEDDSNPAIRIRISGETQLRERQVDSGRVYAKYVEQFIEASLKVEFIEADSGKAVWTGIASDRADIQREGVDITPKKAQQKIQKAVRKMIERLKKRKREPAKRREISRENLTNKSFAQSW